MTVGAADDAYERQADEIADSIVRRLSNPRPIDAAASLNARRVTRIALGEAHPGELERGSEREIRSALGRGRPLDEPVRRRMEDGFGADFSGVRIHTDARADRLNRSLSSDAFTAQRDIFFRAGQYEPKIQRGRELVAHELTHTLQQGSVPSSRIHRAARAPDVQARAPAVAPPSQARRWRPGVKPAGARQPGPLSQRAAPTEPRRWRPGVKPAAARQPGALSQRAGGRGAAAGALPETLSSDYTVPSELPSWWHAAATVPPAPPPLPASLPTGSSSDYGVASDWSPLRESPPTGSSSDYGVPSPPPPLSIPMTSSADYGVDSDLPSWWHAAATVPPASPPLPESLPMGSSSDYTQPVFPVAPPQVGTPPQVVPAPSPPKPYPKLKSKDPKYLTESTEGFAELPVILGEGHAAVGQGAFPTIDQYMISSFGWSQADVDKYVHSKQKCLVSYLDPEARKAYEVHLGATVTRGPANTVFDTSTMTSKFSGKGFAIYVMSPSGEMYADQHKVGLFHHSSFLAGAEVAAAGEIRVTGGKVRYVTNKTGHYKAGAEEVWQLLHRFRRSGMDLKPIDVVILDAGKGPFGPYPGGAEKFYEDKEPTGGVP
jgi:hypothetical protein